MQFIIIQFMNLNSHIHPILTYFLLILLLIKSSTAKLTVYDAKNNEISSYDNVDFMGIDKANYGTVTGKLLIASFIEPKNSNDDACKINNLPLNEEISILVIPFQDAYDVGCRSYSDIIKSNNWEINQNNANNYNIPKNLPPETPNGAQPGEPGGDNINNGLPNNNGAQIPPQQQNYGNPNNNNNINNIPNGKGFNDNNNVKNNDNVPNPPINQPKQIPPDNQLGQNPPPNNQQLPNNPNPQPDPNNPIPPNNQPAPNAPNNQPNPNPIPNIPDVPPVNIPNVPVNIPNIPDVPVNIPNIPNVPVDVPNIPNVPVDVPKVTADGVPVNVPSVTADSVPVNVPSVTDIVPVSVPSVTDIVPVSVPTVTNINVPTATSTPDIVPIRVPSVTNIPAASQSSSSQTAANSPTATSSAPLVTANANVNTPVVNANVSVGLRKRQEQYTPIPKVLVFSSMNGGEPGIKEIYSGDRDVLKGSIPGLTLLKYSDIAQLKKVNDQIDHGEISSGRGKWYNLVTSPSWVAWSIIMSIIYTIISIITIHKLISHYHKCGFSLKNVKYFCYPGIALICMIGIILLVVDPGDVYEDRLSLFTRSFINNLKIFLLMIFFTILEIEWKKAASKICQTHNYHNHKMISFLSKIYSYILTCCIFIFVICFFIKTLSFLDTTAKWFNLMIKVSYILESISIGIVGIEFILFGSYIILAVRRKGRAQRLIYRRRRKKAVKLIIMNISFILAVIFLILAGAVQFLLPTIVNFWIQLILGNIATAVSCILIVLVLQDKTIGKHIQLANNNRNIDLQITTTTTQSTVVEIETPTPNNNNKRLSMNAPPTPPTPLTPMTLTSMTSLLRNNLTTINELPKRNEMVIGTNRLSDYNNHNRNNRYRFSNFSTNSRYENYSNYSNRHSINDSNKLSSSRTSMYSIYTSINDMTYSNQSYLDRI